MMIEVCCAVQFKFRLNQSLAKAICLDMSNSSMANALWLQRLSLHLVKLIKSLTNLITHVVISQLI